MKRILYIDHGKSESHTRRFADGLRTLGEVTMATMLSDETVERLRRGEDGHPFDAVVSHLSQSSASGPYSEFSSVNRIARKIRIYGPAFELLGKMKHIADIPIVVFTGAGRRNIPPMSWDKSGVDEIVHKSGYPENDACRVVEIIQNAWKEYAALPHATEPCCQSNGSGLFLETPVRLNSGLGPYCGGTMVKLLLNFRWRMEVIKDKENTHQHKSANNLLEIMYLEVTCGTRLKIYVDETTPAARDALRQVHRLLNARYLERTE